ncbi:MAG: VWA domain-containing protein, partial [Polyangiaceae bacterium]|nr:VWA domain-containing protein [Polyangiaceae bacterium]
MLCLGWLAALVPALYVGLVWAELVPERFVRLGSPALALVAPLAASVAVWTLLRAPWRPRPWRRHLADLAAMVAVLAAALAATRPELGRPLDRLTVIAVVDRSRSIDLVPDAEVRVARELEAARGNMRAGDRIGVVVFGATAACEEVPRERDEPRPTQRATVARDGTDLAAALRRGLAEVPSDSAARLVLVSDGVATRGDALAAAAAAVTAQIPIDVVALEQREAADVRLVSLRAPPRASLGESIELRIVTSSPAATRLELRLSRDGVPLRRFAADVAAGEDVLRVREVLDLPGLHRYDLSISAADPALDASPDDNTATTFVRVRGPARALVLAAERGKSAFVAGALERAGFAVEQGDASSVPADVAAAAGYDLIVLGDIPAADVSPLAVAALASYVRDLGGGLWLLGGPGAMGPGGYAGSPLEEVAPVSFDLKDEQRRASLAEVIAIDISGSMAMQVSGRTKLELANEAAARSAELLGAGDSLGVVHVDTVPRWAVPVGPVSDKAAVGRAIRAVGPGGGGILVPVALEAAYAALAPAEVNLKHVLLFSDGDDAEDLGAPATALVRGAAQKGITTSIVALGRGKDVGALAELSKLGNGRFYLVEDATRLPAVFTQETVLASRSAIKEDPFVVQAGASGPATAGVDLDAAPPLEGYVVTIPKPRATVLLTGPEGDPVLATWRAGLGRSAAFTSDLEDRWGQAWTHWPGAARLVAQLGRELARSGDDARVRLEAEVAAGELRLRATAVDDGGRSESFRRLRAVVSGPDGWRRDVALEAAGPGLYEAALPLSRPGAYVAVARDEVTGDAVATTGAALTEGEELRPTGSDLGALARIAELTGGRKRDNLADVFQDRAARRFAYRDVTGSLFA